MKAPRKARRTLADAERELAVARAQVEMLQTMNAKLVDALTHAATHPCPPVYVGDPVVQPFWCHIDGANNAGCAAPQVFGSVWTGTVGGATVGAAVVPGFTHATVRASWTLS